jgi:hypothetical protein
MNVATVQCALGTVTSLIDVANGPSKCIVGYDEQPNIPKPCIRSHIPISREIPTRLAVASREQIQHSLP